MGTGKITKTEGLLLGMAGLFLCVLLGLFLQDRRAQVSVETEVQVAQEEIVPDLSPLNLNRATAEELAGADWIKLLIFGPEAEQKAAEAMLCARGLDRAFEIMQGTTDIVRDAKYFELLPAGVNKGTGVRTVRALPETAGRKILCVGDYWNDAAMLREADVSFAPENAIGEIRAMADHVVPDNNSDAVAHIITDWIPRL